MSTTQESPTVSELQEQLEASHEETQRWKAKFNALLEICAFLGSPFRTKFDALTPRDFYGRLYGTTDGCRLCCAEATTDEHSIKSYVNTPDCALTVLGIVEEDEVVIVS